MSLYFQLKESNPYIGNPNYEVVVSDFNFDLHDLNKDKVISKTEFVRSEMVPREEVDSLFSFVDANGNYGLIYLHVSCKPLSAAENIKRSSVYNFRQSPPSELMNR